MTHTDTPANRPTVRLIPKAEARAIRHGFPWVYANELVMDRRTRGLAPGTIANLEDANRTAMGVVAVNPASKIVCRMLDQDPDAQINQSWIAARIKRALAHRSRLYVDPFYRLIHAESDGLPGVVIDRFGDVAVVQPNAAWADVLIGPLVDALVAVTGVATVVVNGHGRARTLEGLSETMDVPVGTSPDAPVAVPMNGAVYMADVMGGQKTGLFFDQRPNHAFAASLAKEARVLDVFSHVGGFGLACLAHGAASVLAVDGSTPALDLAQGGAAQMGVTDRFAVRKGDAFDVLTALAEEGAQYDLVVCDPPAFAPSRQSLDAGLRAYERVARLAAPLVAEGGYLALCSCSHAADLTKFRNASSRGIGRAGRRGQIIHTGYAGPDYSHRLRRARSSAIAASGRKRISESDFLPPMRVLVDACVLYPTVMREVVIGCGQKGLIEPKWSMRILEEWARAAARLGPEQEVFARGEIAMLGTSFPNAIVPAHPGLEGRLWLPDADDIHVLASAIAGSCDAILTVNAKDFPGNLLADEGVFRADPDAFLRGLLEEFPDDVCAVADDVLAKANQLSDRPWDMRALMKKARLPRFGKALV